MEEGKGGLKGEELPRFPVQSASVVKHGVTLKLFQSSFDVITKDLCACV